MIRDSLGPLFMYIQEVYELSQGPTFSCHQYKET